MENYQPKISILEIFLLVIWGIALDTIGLAGFTVADLLGIATTQFYFRLKGVNGAGYDLIASLLEFIPFIDFLPMKTAGIVIVIWIDRHPKGVIAETAAKAAKVMPIKSSAGFSSKVDSLSKIAVIVLATLIFGFTSVHAQTKPEFMTSWKAYSYAPPTFKGKILPTRNSKIDVAFEIIDGGRLADLSNTTVRWYVDNKLQKSGVNLKNFTFNVSTFPGRNNQVRIVAVNYKGVNLEKNIFIPVVAPQAVIYKSGTNNFTVLPYFFNVSDFSRFAFIWSANGNEILATSEMEKPDQLELNSNNLPSGSRINLGVSVRNFSNELEFASYSINFLIK